MKTSKETKKRKRKEHNELEVCGKCGKEFSMFKYIKGSYVYKYKQTYFCGYKCWDSFMKEKEKAKEEESKYCFKEETCRNCRLLRQDGSCPKWEDDDIPNDLWCEGWEKRRRTQQPVPDDVKIKTIELKIIEETKARGLEIQCSKLLDYVSNPDEYNNAPCENCSKKNGCKEKITQIQ